MTTLFAAFEDRILGVTGGPEDWSARTVYRGSDLQAVAAHPDTPERVLAGTASDGVLRSVDGGDSWERVGSDRISEMVTAVASEPTDGEVFYAGTEPSRVYRSRDGGSTWSHLDGLTDLASASTWAFPPRPSTHHVRWIEVAPDAPDRLFVAIEAGALVRSHDGGRSWMDRVDGGPRDSHTMRTHPDAPGRVWAAAGDGFAESADGGDSWHFSEEGLDHRYCWSLAVDPGDPETVLVSAATGPRRAHTTGTAESYVYRREGDGPWTRSGQGLPDGSGMLRPVLGQGLNRGEAYLASNLGLYRTGTMGEEWTRLAIAWPDACRRQTARGLSVLPS